MKITCELDDRQGQALKIIAAREKRSVSQYLRDAIFFLVKDRAARYPEVAVALGWAPGAAAPRPGSGENAG